MRGISSGERILGMRVGEHLTARRWCWERYVSPSAHCSQKSSLVMCTGEDAGVVNVHHTLLYLITRVSAENWKEVWNSCLHLCRFSKLEGKSALPEYWRWRPENQLKADGRSWCVKREIWYGGWGVVARGRGSCDPQIQHQGQKAVYHIHSFSDYKLAHSYQTCSPTLFTSSLLSGLKLPAFLPVLMI